MKIGVYDSTRKRIVAVCTKSCKFKIYASWDKEKATYVVRTVIDHHNVEETYLRTGSAKSSWLAKYCLYKFREKPS